MALQLGLTVFALVWMRVAARLMGKTPPIVPAVRRWQRVAANVVEFILYGLMVVLPILGWVTLSAEGHTIPFFGLQLPALVSDSTQLAERTEALHVTLATLGYFVIGLHAVAALFHLCQKRQHARADEVVATLRARAASGGSPCPSFTRLNLRRIPGAID